MTIETIPSRFIDQPIDVAYDREPLLEKSPHCPDRFNWEGNLFTIEEVISEWRDFSRKGRMSRNLSPAHSHHAAGAGSWGVGRFFFRVRVEKGQVFDIYYDRAPNDSSDRKGHWFMLGERTSIKKTNKP